MKLNISDPKSAKSHQVEVEDKVRISFLGKKVKDEVELTFVGDGFKGVITGGSNKQGFPMLPSLDSENSKRILLPKGIGFNTKRKGERRRKRVAGKIIGDNTEQVNIKLLSGDINAIIEKFPKEEKKEDNIPKPMNRR